MRPFGPVLLLVGFVGCSELTFAGCDDVSIPGIRAVMFDARSGAPVADSVTAIARDGGYADTLRSLPLGPPVFWGASDRPGTYRLDVSAPGYRAWSSDAIRVRDGGCHPETVDVIVNLSPL